MDRRFKVVMFALFCGICLRGAAFAQSSDGNDVLPDGEGKAEYIHNCTACHRTEMVTQVKKTPAEWRKSVDEMASRGTDGTKEDLDKVVLYLDKFYSTDKPAGPPTPPPPAKPTGSAAAVRPKPEVRLTAVERRWLAAFQAVEIHKLT